MSQTLRQVPVEAESEKALGTFTTTVATRSRWRRRLRQPKSLVARIVLNVILVLFALLFLYPFAWLIAASFKPRGEVFDNALIPKTFVPENYVEVCNQLPLLNWMGNSIAIALLAAGAVAISSSIVAFGFAYFRFPGRGLLFGLVLATMMLPGAVTMIPIYLIWKETGLNNAITAALLGDKSPEDALKEAQEAAMRAYENATAG